MNKGTAGGERHVFLDWWRTSAIFAVMVIHACEPFYLDAEGTAIASPGDLRWVAAIDGAIRAAVPLFVIASSFLLFPTRRATGDFLKRRLARVLVPFGIWSIVYAAVQGGDWRQFLFNFPAGYGHLWFVWMIAGVYLLMPLLSPWAERVTERELRGWLILWLFTTLLPFVRALAVGLGFSGELYGEANCNPYGAFYYASGFVGYVLAGLYLKRFVADWTWRRTAAVALPLLLAGWSIAFFGFMAPVAGLPFPVKAPIELAVKMEIPWGFCSFSVALTVFAYALVLRKADWGGAVYRRVVLPCSRSSFGVYLVHMLILPHIVEALRGWMPTPVCIFAAAILTFALATVAILALSRVPAIGEYVSGCRRA